MKNYILLFLSLISVLGYSQVGIGTTTPDNNSILDVVSSNKGILIPRVELDDLSTGDPLASPISDGMLIYSDGGMQLDGFYYWESGKWNPIGRRPKRIHTVLTSGGNTGLPHIIPSDTDKFETFDGNFAFLFEMPGIAESNMAGRLNEIITVQKRSTFNVNISNTNTDLGSNITLTGSQTAVFLFDGTKWVHIHTSN